MLNRPPNHSYPSRLPRLPHRPPSPTLISLDSAPVIPTLLEAQDELDLLAIDEKARRAQKGESTLTSRPDPSPQLKFLVDLEESELAAAAKQPPTKKPPEAPLRDRSKRAPRVAPLIEVEFNESLLLSAPRFWKPKSKDAPALPHQRASVPLSKRATTPSGSYPNRPAPPRKPTRPPAAPVPAPRQRASTTSKTLIVSPTPRRALPLHLRSNAPIFRPLHTPPPRLATPSSLSTASTGERVGEIYITSSTKISKLFQADIKYHYFPPIPKIFWGRSEEQAKREREKAALASDSEEEDDLAEVYSEGSYKRSRYQRLWEEKQIDQTPIKRQKSIQPKRSSVDDLGKDYPHRRPTCDHAAPLDHVPLNVFAEPYIPQEEVTPRRPPAAPALVDVSIPTPEPLPNLTNGAAYNEIDVDDDMDASELGAHYDTVSAFGPFEEMMNKSAYRRLLSMPSARTNIPPGLKTRARTRPLDHTILAAWSKTEPTRAARDQVGGLLNKLTTYINLHLNPAGSSKQKGPRFEVDVFGSVSWGGETGQSGDLDLVVIDHGMPYGYEPKVWDNASSLSPPPSRAASRARTPRAITGLPPVYNLRRLADVLRQAGMIDPFVIRATTPIVKFSAPGRPGEKALECDINVNDLGGWYNSSLILHYCLVSPFVLRPLIYALKRWAAAFDLNDPSGAKGAATMSSYCLTLMAIAYLQHRGVLPNLQGSVGARIPTDPGKQKDLIWVAWSRAQGIAANIGFDTSPPTGWASREPEMTVGEAIRGFFSFFAESGGSAPGGRMDWDSKMISILQGGIVNRAAKHGVITKVKEASIEKLELDGFHPTDVHNVMKDFELEAEKNMGKGDKGIQPLKWVESHIVVQDPFLWEKNCAAGMSKKGKARFFNQLDATHQLLSRNVNATLDDMVFNPEPPIHRPSSQASSRGWGGGRARGRGRGSGRGKGGGKRSPSPKTGQMGSLVNRLGPAVAQR